MSDILLDHIHLRAAIRKRSRLLSRHFGVEIIDRMEVRNLQRVVLRLGAVAIFVEGATDDMPRVPAMPFRGIEHFCLRVLDINAQAARLERLACRCFHRCRR